MSYFLAIYLTGLAATMVVGLGVIEEEPTAHGQGIMLPFLLFAAGLWPLTWLLIFAFPIYSLFTPSDD